jgi:Protein of unknown function (DUF2628)
MSVYTVHEPPLRAAEAHPDPERIAFVRGGFYFWAFLLPPLWMLRYGMWLVFLIYVVIAVGVENAMHYAGVGSAGLTLAELLISLLVGIEASTLRRFTLAWRGWKNIGIVSGYDLEDAERRFFSTWVGAAPGKRVEPPPTSQTPPVAPVPRVRQTSDVIGLFPEPGGQL